VINKTNYKSLGQNLLLTVLHVRHNSQNLSKLGEYLQEIQNRSLDAVTTDKHSPKYVLNSQNCKLLSTDYSVFSPMYITACICFLMHLFPTDIIHTKILATCSISDPILWTWLYDGQL